MKARTEPKTAPAKRVAAFLLLALTCCLSAGELQFDYFPGEAYRSEEATFILRGQAGSTLTVTLNDKVIAESTFTDTALKQRLLLAEAGTLIFTSDDHQCQFQLIAPRDEIELSERDGYLYHGDHPAILLPDHVHPPKHDRTWEGWRLISSIFVTPEERRIASEVRLHAPPDTTFHELHGLIQQLPKAVSKDLILLQITPQDLKLGVSDLSFRMRLEWMLQKLAPLKGKQLMVVMVYHDVTTRDRYAFAERTTKLASRSGGAEFATLTLTPSDHLAPDGLKRRIDALLDDAFAMQAGAQE